MYYQQHQQSASAAAPSASSSTSYPGLQEGQQQQQQQQQQQPQHLLSYAYGAEHQHQGPISPLDALVRDGKQARRDVRAANRIAQDGARGGGEGGAGTQGTALRRNGLLSNDILNRATSLSRSTSIRTAHPTSVTEDHDAGEAGAGRNNGSSGSSNSNSNNNNNNNNNLAPGLIRRDSVDTVRSDEFGAGGRWAKAWTTRPEDEQSLYDDEYEDGRSSQWDAESYHSVEIDWDQGTSAGVNGSASDEHEFQLAQAALQAAATPIEQGRPQQQYQQQQPHLQQGGHGSRQPVVASSSAAAAAHPGAPPASVLVWPPTPQGSYHAGSTNASSSGPSKRDSTATLRESDRRQPAQPATSFATSNNQGFSSSPDRMSDEQRQELFYSLPQQQHPQSRAPPYVSSAEAYAASSADKYRRASGDGRTDQHASSNQGLQAASAPVVRSFSGPDTLPSSASSSASASLSSARSLYSAADVTAQQQQLRYRSGSGEPRPPVPPQSRTATGSSSSRNSTQAPHNSGPVAPATLLNQAVNGAAQGRADASSAGAHPVEPVGLRSPRGHPAGRKPPPPPSADGYVPSGRPISGRYGDPNSPYTTAHEGNLSRGAESDAGLEADANGERDWTASLGKHRAAVLAAHDGRASLVSDLDVETLRLDGASSRRSSTSTIGVAYRQGQEHSQGQAQAQAQGQGYGLGQGASTSYLGGRADGLALQRRSVETWREPPRSSTEMGLPRSQTMTILSTPTMSASSGGSNFQPNINPSSINNTTTPSHPAVHPKPTPKPISTAEELLSRGIEYHEAGDLSRSVFYFERSAKVEGGCVVGMCMFGMALREGWGAKKDPRRGFEWIQAAATRAGEVLKVTLPRTEAEITALKSELKLAVYELGKCYCYGWGVKLDKRMALEYFELAAKLGDADAQAEAGALYATGKGCKKDLKKAARYYRQAEAQGYDTVGLSWIHKDKYL
ncbi:hypothetical protein OC835_002869 [Tilletia horrida]|nr:hypothetical protein OC835_002869 [Tilletia horrida]